MASSKIMADSKMFREIIAVRSHSGLGLFNGPPSFAAMTDFIPDAATYKVPVMKFSPDGCFLAWVSKDNVVVSSCEDGSCKQRLAHGYIQEISFSPKSSFIAVWHQYVTVAQNPQGTPNLHIYSVEDGANVKSFIQKKHTDWCPQWSMDEKLCARIVSNEVHIYADANFSVIAAKMHVQKIQAFGLSPVVPYHLTAYVPSAKSAPAFVRVHKYPQLAGTPIASRSFYKCDKIKMVWNAAGTAVVVQAEADADKSNTSYYGESQIFLLTTKGDSSQVGLAQKKRGPVYAFDWHPDSNMFGVVYGFVPPRASFINVKGEEVYDFGEGYRNAIHFSPFGNLLAFTAFGNMQGGCEVWDVERRRLISKPVMKDSTDLIWCPDGTHLISSTVTPRLRVANGYRYWHYSGALLHEDVGGVNTEVYDVQVRPAPPGTHNAPEVSYRVVEGLEQAAAKKAVAYVPPQARHAGIVTAGVYKSVGKQPVGLQPNSRAKTHGGSGMKDDILAKPLQQVPAALETQKRIRNIQKKLDQISALKQKQASGDQLELNQVEKIKGEAKLLEELKSLQI